MKPGIPWSVKGIESETREAAKAAARQSGLTIGQWLNSMIKEGAHDQARAFDGKSSTNKRKSAKKSKKHKKNKSSQKVEFSDRLDALADQLAALAEQSQATAVNKFVEYDDNANADRAMKAMIKRIESGEKRTKKSFDSVTSRLNSIDEKLEARSPKEPTLEFQALETAMRNIVEHIETSEKRSRETLGDMQERMAELSRRAEGADNAEVTKNAPAIAQLEARVADLGAQLEAADASGKKDAISYLDERLSGFGEQIDAMRHSNDAMTKRAELSAVDAAKRETREVEQRVANLIGEARNLMMKSVPAAENLTSIKGEIESLNQRFDDIKTEAASDHDVQALRSTIENLAASVSAGNDTSSLDDMENRLAELTVRLDETSVPDQMAPQFNELEDRIHSLDQKLVEAINQQSDATAFSALESQIGLVADRLSTTEESLSHLTTIENSISQLYTSIEETKEWAQQAADGAANRMADELLEKGLPAAPNQGPSPELHALEQGLAAVKQSAQVAEQQNQETLEAVHETLEQIITKLAVIESTPPAQAPAAPDPTMAAQVSGDALQSQPNPVLGAQPGVDADPQQQGQWADPFQSHLETQAPQVAATSSAQEQPAPLLEDAIASQDVTPAFDPGPLPDPSSVDAVDQQPTHTPENVDEKLEVAPEIAETAEIQSEDDTDAPLDYIAQARLASQSASGNAPLDKKKGLGFFTDRVLPGNRKDDGQGEVEKKKSKSLFTLPFLSKKKPTAENDQETNAVAEAVKAVEAGVDVEPGKEKDGGRKRLIVAGLILLIAAGGFAYTKFGGGAVNVQKAAAPDPVLSAPEKSGSGNHTPAKKVVPEKVSTDASKGQTAAQTNEKRPVKNISLIVPAKPQSQSNITAAQTGMPVSSALNAGNQPTNAITAAPTDPVTTASLPPNPPVANHANINSPLNISTGLNKKAPAAVVEPAFSSGQMPPEASGTIELRTAAAKGDPSAQFVVASRFIDGKTMKRDFSQAASWYQKAASSGLAPAQYRLGTLFERGNGLPKDMNAARLWYERAAEQGNVKAMHNLAVIYANGRLGQADFAKAKKWFLKAAAHGLQDSQYNLAVILERGLTGKANKAEAFIWYSLAANRGDKDARVKAHGLKNYLPAADLKALEKRVATWRPQPPVKAGNFVAIKDPKWRVASRGHPNPAKPVLGAKPSLKGPTLIKTTQNLLSKLGYDVGKPDGVMGSRTANAVRLFQLRNGLSVNGMVSNSLLQQLQARS